MIPPLAERSRPLHRQGLLHGMNPAAAGLFSSPALHHNTEPSSPRLLLVVTTTTEILKESRGQYISRQFFSHQLIPMTNQLNAFQTIDDQDLLNATGGGFGLTMAWVAANVVTGGVPIIADALINDGKITQAVQDA